MTSIFLSARSANLLWMGLSLATSLGTISLYAATHQIGAHTFTLPEGFQIEAVATTNHVARAKARAVRLAALRVEVPPAVVPRVRVRIRLPARLPGEQESAVGHADRDQAARAAVLDGHLVVVNEAALRTRPVGAHGAHVLRVVAASHVPRGQLVLANGKVARQVDSVELRRHGLARIVSIDNSVPAGGRPSRRLVELCARGRRVRHWPVVLAGIGGLECSQHTKGPSSTGMKHDFSRFRKL